MKQIKSRIMKESRGECDGGDVVGGRRPNANYRSSPRSEPGGLDRLERGQPRRLQQHQRQAPMARLKGRFLKKSGSDSTARESNADSDDASVARSVQTDESIPDVNEGGLGLDCLSGLYRDLPRVLHDAAALVSSPLGAHLRPSAETIRLEDGSSSRPMLVLRGTLPFEFDGVAYNAPVEVRLPHPYPAHCPTAFVRPAASMAIRDNHRHVGLDGRVYMPYLNGWTAGTHDLRGLAVRMSGLFGDDPPCYTKPAADASTAAAFVGKSGNDSNVGENASKIQESEGDDQGVCMKKNADDDGCDPLFESLSQSEPSMTSTSSTSEVSDEEAGSETDDSATEGFNQVKRLDPDGITHEKNGEILSNLEQIHTAKISIQRRMSCLERDANISKMNAVKAQRNGMTKLALVHTRRQSSAMEEFDQCASDLENLDTIERRLERARNDVQIVQTYTSLSTALQDIRLSKSASGDDMKVMNGIGEYETDPGLALDEDKLNEEFKQLKLMCEKDGGSEGGNAEVGREGRHQYETPVANQALHHDNPAPPWADDEARTYNYSPHQPWEDPGGLLWLSGEQRERLHKWARPSEIIAMRRSERRRKPLSRDIAVINSITPYTIKQHCVSDCSFIAGLCISAAYELRFNRRLVSSLIYPQDPDTGMPVYNPMGVYMVKLWLNGVARRVLVDDLFPVDKDGNLLCSHTTPPEFKGLELWVPLLEKAYMKLCGGYNFPGSNSGVDLFCLNGWIPEKICFPRNLANTRDFEMQVERAFQANSKGDCLISVSTSKELTEEQAAELGLYTGHAYAVLRIVETYSGLRLLQLKNPWATKGWKGRFSAQDRASWCNPGLCEKVGCDPTSLFCDDDGVFWMSWEDALQYFRNIHISWSTDLFRYHTAVHGIWESKIGPSDDSFNVGENPQYTLKLSSKAIRNKATLWLLLSRHITKQEQEGGESKVLSRLVSRQEQDGDSDTEASDFFAMHIHRISKPQQRVWYPEADRTYTNNQHVLVRYEVAGPEDKFLSIVLSQYNKRDDLGYTLSCYCTERFSLGQPEVGLPISCELNGSWKLRDNKADKPNSLPIGTAGGPLDKGSFGSNPQWSIQVPAKGARIQVKCTIPKEIAVNVIVARTGPGDLKERRSKRVHRLCVDPIIDTGTYRHCFAVSEAVFVPAGLYTLVASTLEAGQVGDYSLQVLSSKEMQIEEID